MTANIPTGVTAEMLQAAIESPGQVVSNGAPQSFRPSHSVPISGYDKSIKPQVKGQENAPRVTSVNMAANNEKAEAEQQRIRKEAAAEAKRREELRNFSDPSKLQAQLAVMNRQIKKLQKEIKALQEKQ